MGIIGVHNSTHVAYQDRTLISDKVPRVLGNEAVGIMNPAMAISKIPTPTVMLKSNLRDMLRLLVSQS